MRILLAAIFSLVMAVPGPARAGDAQDQAEILKLAQEAVATGSFAAVEELSRRFRGTDRRTGSGSMKSTIFDDEVVSAISSRNAPEQAIKHGVELASRWAAENPASPMAHILYARVLIQYANYFRGQGYANTVSEETWKQYHKHLEAPSRYLVEHADVASKDARWHALMIALAKRLSWTLEQVGVLAREGLKLRADDDRIHFEMATYLLPKWSGDTESLDRYINEAAQATTRERGMELYARLYADVAQDQYDHRLYIDSKIDWRKMKIGFADLLARYPDMRNVNTFAYHACIAGDKELARKLIAGIGATPVLRRWNPNGQRTFAQCQQWAAQP